MLLRLLLPLPMEYGQMLNRSMQSCCSAVSSRVLDLFGINHRMYGNILIENGRRYFVDSACSHLFP